MGEGGGSLDERLRAIGHRFGIHNLIEVIASFSVARHMALAATINLHADTVGAP